MRCLNRSAALSYFSNGNYIYYNTAITQYNSKRLQKRPNISGVGLGSHENTVVHKINTSLFLCQRVSNMLLKTWAKFIEAYCSYSVHLGLQGVSETYGWSDFSKVNCCMTLFIKGRKPTLGYGLNTLAEVQLLKFF